VVIGAHSIDQREGDDECKFAKSPAVRQEVLLKGETAHPDIVVFVHAMAGSIVGGSILSVLEFDKTPSDPPVFQFAVTDGCCQCVEHNADILTVSKTTQPELLVAFTPLPTSNGPNLLSRKVVAHFL